MMRVLMLLVVVALGATGYLLFMHDEAHPFHGGLETTSHVEAESPHWRTFAFEKDGFSVELPISPQHADEEMKDPTTGQVRHYDMYVATPSDGVVYTISLITYKENETLSAETLFKSVQDAMVKAHPGNSLSQSKKGKFQQYESVDFSITNPAAEIDARGILVKNRFYFLTHMAPSGNHERENFERFADSFRLQAASK